MRLSMFLGNESTDVPRSRRGRTGGQATSGTQWHTVATSGTQWQKWHTPECEPLAGAYPSVFPKCAVRKNETKNAVTANPAIKRG